MTPQLCVDQCGPLPPGVWLAEPKIDGVRALVTVSSAGVSVASREGLPLAGCDAILAEVASLRLAPCTLDGELYAGSFEATLSAIQGGVGPLTFHAFDLIVAGDEWMPLFLRKKRLAASIPAASINLRLVQWCLIETRHAEETMDRYVSEGYEGAVFKFDLSTYGQPNSWLKRKPFYECDLRVVSALEGKGRLAGTVGALMVAGTVTWRGRAHTVKTKIGTGFCDDDRRSLWALHQAGKLAGAVVEVGFQEITDAGALRFSMFRRMRPDKT